MNRLLHLLFLVGMLRSASALADNASVLADFQAHRFEAVERQLEATDAAFQAGRISDNDLLDAYKVFYRQRDVLSADMATWERERPTSYIAHLANGTYLRKLGEFRRGQGYIQDVPEEDQRYMLRQFDLAKSELQLVLQLNPRSYLAMLNLVNIAQFEGDDATADAMIALGTKVYPSNLLIRARYLVHLAPRWGGSLPTMESFIAATRKAGISDDVMRLLEAIQCNEQGFGDESAGRIDRALPDYRHCMALARGADPRFLAVYLSNSLMHCSADPGGNNFTCH